MTPKLKIFAPSRPNKRSRDEIAENDSELMKRACFLSGGCQPIPEELEKKSALVDQEPEDTDIRTE